MFFYNKTGVSIPLSLEELNVKNAYICSFLHFSVFKRALENVHSSILLLDRALNTQTF